MVQHRRCIHTDGPEQHLTQHDSLAFLCEQNLAQHDSFHDGTLINYSDLNFVYLDPLASIWVMLMFHLCQLLAKEYSVVYYRNG